MQYTVKASMPDLRELKTLLRSKGIPSDYINGNTQLLVNLQSGEFVTFQRCCNNLYLEYEQF